MYPFMGPCMSPYMNIYMAHIWTQKVVCRLDQCDNYCIFLYNFQTSTYKQNIRNICMPHMHIVCVYISFCSHFDSRVVGKENRKSSLQAVASWQRENHHINTSHRKNASIRNKAQHRNTGVNRITGGRHRITGATLHRVASGAHDFLKWLPSSWL